MHLVVNIVCGGNEDDKLKAVAAIRKTIDECAKAGYGEYRTHTVLADQVAHMYGWNNQSMLKFHEAIKDSLDPNDLSPGCNGIWQNRYRKAHTAIIDNTGPEDWIQTAEIADSKRHLRNKFTRQKAKDF